MRQLVLPERLSLFDLAPQSRFAKRRHRLALLGRHDIVSMDVGIGSDGGLWSGQTLYIDGSYGAARYSVRPLEFRSSTLTGGHYAVDVLSGVIAGAVSGNAPLFAFRWTQTSFNCVIERIVVNAVSTAISSPTYTDLELIKATNWTAMDTTGNNPSTPFSRMNTATMSASLQANTNILIANTAAISAGTRTLDGAGMGYVQYFNAAANNLSGPLELYHCRDHGKHPLILDNNEGFVIRTPKGWASSNSQLLGVTVEWVETPTYGLGA